MKRNIYNKLLEWKDDDYCKPLMLEGARQVGKTFILKQFGTSEFETWCMLTTIATSLSRPCLLKILM